MAFAQKQGTVQDLQDTLIDLKDQLVTGLAVEKPDYIELARIKKLYELNVNGNQQALKGIVQDAARYKETDPAYYEQALSILPNNVKAQLGDRYNFDTREGTAPTLQAQYGLRDDMARSLQTALMDPANATPEDVSLLNRFNTVKAASPNNNAEVKMHLEEFDALRKNPTALGGLNDYTASKLFEARAAAGGGMSIPELRAVFDPMKQAFTGKGDTLDPEAGNKMAADALAQAVKVAGIGKAAYVIKGIKMALEANPVPEGGASQMQVLVNKAANFALTDTSEETANRVAQEWRLSRPERDELAKATSTIALSRAGLADPNSPAVTAANALIDTNFPNLDTRNGMSGAINQLGANGLIANVAKAKGISVDKLPATVIAKINTATELAITVAQLDRRVKATGLAPTFLDAFSDSGKNAGRYTDEQLRAQKITLATARTRETDPDKQQLLDDYAAAIDARLGDAQTPKYKTVDEATGRLLKRTRGLSSSELQSAVGRVQTAIEAGLQEVYTKSSASWKGLVTSIGPDSQQRADALREEALNTTKIRIGGEDVPLRSLMPYLQAVPFNDESGHARYGIGVGMEPAGEKGSDIAKRAAKKLTDALLVSGTPSFDAKTRELKLGALRTGTGTDGQDYTVDGFDVTTPKGGAELAAKLLGDPRAVETLKNYSTWRVANDDLTTQADDIEKGLGLPGFTRETLLTGRTGTDGAAVSEASSRANGLLKGTGGTPKERVQNAQADLLVQRGKSLVAQDNLAQQTLALKQQALKIDQEFKQGRMDAETYKTEILKNHYAQRDAKTAAETYKIQQESGAPAAP